MDREKEDLLPQVWKRRFFVVAFLALAALLMYKLKGVLTPFVLAWLAAYLVSPLVNWLEKKRKFSRIAAVNTVISVVGVLILAVLIVTVPIAIHQTITLAENVPEYIEDLRDRLGEARARLDLPEAADGVINNAVERLKSSSPEIAKFAGSLFMGWLSSFFALFGFLFSLVMFVFIFYFFLRDFPRINEGMIQAVPKRYRETTKDLFAEMDSNLKTVLRGQLIVAIAMSVLYAIGLSIAGVPYGILIGFIAGLGNFLPFIGPMLGMIPAVLLVLLEHGFDLQSAMYSLIGVAVAFGVVQFLEGFFLTPQLAGGSVGLGPVTTLFAISAGGVLFGFIGVVAALPVAAIMKVVLIRLWKTYRNSDFFQSAET